VENDLAFVKLDTISKEKSYNFGGVFVLWGQTQYYTLTEQFCHPDSCGL
jgi:hypothetical protein